MDPRDELKAKLAEPERQRRITSRGLFLLAATSSVWAVVVAAGVLLSGDPAAKVVGVSVFFAAVPIHAWYAWRLAAAEQRD